MTENQLRSTPVRTFVRHAWVLLVFQLLAGAVALGVTSWAALRVRPLLVQRDELMAAVAQAERRLTDLRERERAASDRVEKLKAQEAQLRARLQASREATRPLTDAINAFHRRDYGRALRSYDEALQLDPENAYVHDLKSYTQFKAGDLQGAIRTVSRALELNRAYDWGYFDLARYQCAAKSSGDALSTIQSALKERGAEFRNRIEFFVTRDHEFQRLCKPILDKLRALR